MIGPIFNAAGIVIGGMFGLLKPTRLTPAQEGYLKLALAVLTVYYGLRLTWLNLGGTVWQVTTQVLIMVVAMMIGRLIGKLLKLQHHSNQLGKRARERMSRPPAQGDNRVNEGFRTCSALFCAAPLGLIGAIQDGLTGYWPPLAVKAFIDALGAMGFVMLFGWGAVLSALPVLALFGTISILCAYGALPFLESHGLLASVNAVSGLMIFSVALIMLGLKKIELTDYLPSLAMAPLLTWLFR